MIEKIILKNKKQIDGIRRSCGLSATVLDFIQPHVKEGVTTNYLNNLMAEYIKDHKAIPAPLNYRGYPKETCISLNEVICHGIPNEQVLKNGDILNIDVTTILDGYYGDTSRMFTVGKINKEARDLLSVTEKCLKIGIEEVFPGNPIGNIGYIISTYANIRGYSAVFQFCGHGVGLEFHEPPEIHHVAEKNSGPEMRPGMIFTIEPMINIGVAESVITEDNWTALTADKKLSAQYEHTILVTETGYEILTLSENYNE
jgi:methionyl aminopeptidase